MAKKSKKVKRLKVHSFGDAHEDRVMRELQDFKHKDLQRACVLRGLEFNQVVEMNHHSLVNWFYKNYDNTQNPNNLTEYDAWMEGQLKNRGYKNGEAMLSPCFRLGYTQDMKNVDKTTDLKPASTVPKPGKKPPAAIDKETGVRAGTKKALTYQLTQAKKPLESIIKEVTEAFPGADSKSIRIWHKRCLKAMKEVTS